MKFEVITIKDIAKALGLSASTVSRALRDSWEISPETKERVTKYAQENNYHPNPIALGLKDRRTQSIGVVVSELANSFFSEAINGIESVCKASGYNVVVAQTNDSNEQENQIVQTFISRSLDGLIVSVGNETVDDSIYARLVEKNFPVVFFDRVLTEIETYKIKADNYDGAYEATRFLMGRGYRNIACMCTSQSLSIARERTNGLMNAMRDAGLEPDPAMIKFCSHGGKNHAEVEYYLQELLSQPRQPDAIFAMTDSLSTAVLRVLKSWKIQVPEQIGLIGYSNSPVSDLLCPALTVIVQPAFGMGKLAAELLIKTIESKRPVADFETRVLKSRLVLRNSTR